MAQRYSKAEWAKMSKDARDKILTERKALLGGKKFMKKQFKKANGVLPAGVKGLKKDARFAKNDIRAVTVSTENPTITVEIPIDPTNLYGVCLSYVSYAMSRGYLGYVDAPDFAYWSAVYMLQVLIAYVQGSTPQAAKLPLWLQQFGQALSPKVVPCGNGSVYYRFVTGVLATPFVPPSAVAFGPSAYGYEHLLYIPSGAPTPIDGFPNAAPPSAYTSDNGANAWNSLAQFMIQPERRNSAQADLVSTSWSKNVSAFAQPIVPEGQGWSGSAGWFYQSALEVPVFTPVLSTFATLLAEGAYNPKRVANFTANSSGDSLYASAMFHQLVPMSHVSTKDKTLFHFIDFLQGADILASYVAALVQSACNDPSLTNTTPEVTYKCPLSLQEMELLLRNEICYLFARSQVAAQGISPDIPTGSTDNQFQPFIMSSTTVPLNSFGMQLPLPYVENWKSLLYRIVEFSTKSSVNKGAPKKSKNLLIFCPVLGKYQTDALNQGDYQATTQGSTPVTFDVFTTLADVMRTRRKNSKGEGEFAPMVEVPINLVDGSTGTAFLFINDTTRQSELTTIWNKWITSLSVYSDDLTTLSSDLGVNVCCSIATTRHWIPTPSSYTKMMKDTVDTRLISDRRITATPYAGRQVIAISNHDRPFSAVFDAIQKQWLLPVNRSESGTTQSLSDFNRIALAMKETSTVSSSNVDTGMLMSTINVSYSQKMVHARDAPCSDWCTFFKQENAKGQAGILSGLVADFVGRTFGPGVGSLANTVASIIPI